jgi:hypothetical protein
LERRSFPKPTLKHHAATEDAVTEVAQQIPALLVVYRWLMEAASCKPQPFGLLDAIRDRMAKSEEDRGIAISATDAA